MKKIRSAIVAAAILITVGAVVGEGRARADIPPPDSCSSPGQPCQNAGPNANQAGSCTTTTCRKGHPGEDGGVVYTDYECNLCIAGDPKGESSSGCSIAGTGATTGTTPIGWLLVGLGVVIARRRKTD